MLRSFKVFYAAFEVSVSQTNAPSDELGATNRGFIYVGSRFQEGLLTNGNFYRKLGFPLLTEIRARATDARPVPTCLRLKSSTDGQQLNVFRLYSVALVPLDKDKTIPELGERYKTRFPASCRLSEIKTRDILYSKQFTFGAEGDPTIYVVEEGSMMLIRGKASAAHIAKINTAPANEEEIWQEDNSFEG